MKVQYASDLHLEFHENARFFAENPIVPKADILLLAGDVVQFGCIKDVAWFFDYLSKNFEQTYWIPGNHEYYHYSNINRYIGTFNVPVRENVHLVNNITIKHEDVNFIFSTLWTKIRDESIYYIKQRMNDYRLIRDNDEILSCQKTNMLHEENIAFLRAELSRLQDEKTVVVTHHLPTLINYPKEFKNSSVTEAYAVELSPMIEELKPNVWIYGHSHQSKTKFQIGETILLCNAHGYIHLEKTKYQNARTIRI